MDSYVLDTSAIQAFLDPQDILHEEIRNRFLSLPRGSKFIIPYIVLAELAVGISDLDEIYEFSRILTDNFEFNSGEDIEFISQLNPKKRRSLRANDCLILAICKRERARLITFDKKLTKFANEIL